MRAAKATCESAHMRRLARAFTSRLYDKCRNLMQWTISLKSLSKLSNILELQHAYKTLFIHADFTAIIADVTKKTYFL